MKRPIKIFVEGVADEKFIIDYIHFLTQNELFNVQNIILSNGWNNILSEKNSGEVLRNQMQKNTDNNGSNLIIFDADDNFQHRKNEIIEWGTNYKLVFDVFLLPNNSDAGDLESLLEKIINPINYPIFDCWDNYESCLRSKQIVGRNGPLTTPAKKTKIYGYLEALLGSSKSEKKKIKEKERDYKDIFHWDLNSVYLNPLKEFLKPHFINS